MRVFNHQFPKYRSWLVLGGSITLWASQTQAAPDCQSPSSVQFVIECVLQNDPEIQRAILNAGQSMTVEEEAAQRPNPELGTRTVYGSPSGGTAGTLEINLVHTWEIGGKRGARIERAQAEGQTRVGRLLQAREKAVQRTYHDLYRLRQTAEELSILTEALETFSKLKGQYDSRTRLGPEQEASLAVLQLARADTSLKLVNLETENDSLLQRLSIATGAPFAVTKSVLPPRKTSWARVEISSATRVFSDSSAALADAQINFSQAELSLAKSTSWPDIKLGPSFELQTQNGSQYSTFGFNLSLALPLFHMNGAGRNHARLEVQQAEVSKSLLNRELAAERALLSKSYERAVEALKKSDAGIDLEKEHQRMERLFARGLVPSALVIEAHRQAFDFAKDRNDLELRAIDALLRIYAMEGRLFSEVL